MASGGRNMAPRRVRSLLPRRAVSAAWPRGEFRLLRRLSAPQEYIELELWTGLKKGPPRKLKFPEPDKVVEMLKANLE